MTKKTTRRYVGGLVLDLLLPSGREVTVEPGQTVELLASEVEAIDARSDFTAESAQTTEQTAPETPTEG